MSCTNHASALAAALALFLPFGAATAAERAGETTKVQPASYQRESIFASTLDVGDEIYRDAEVFTEEYGSLIMSLDDGSVLTLGPNSDIVVDEYVYSPGANTGSAALSLGRGMLRVVSGRLPSDSVRIRTPVATIGIRGTDFTLDTAVQEIVKVWVDDGIVTVAPNASPTVFEFEAPAFAICSTSGCDRGEPEQRPRAFPEPPEEEVFEYERDEPGGGGGGGHD